jgi:hypothetical protein
MSRLLSTLAAPKKHFLAALRSSIVPGLLVLSTAVAAQDYPKGWVVVGADSAVLTIRHRCFTMPVDSIWTTGMCGNTLLESARDRATGRELIVPASSMFEVRFWPGTDRVTVRPHGWSGRAKTSGVKEEFQVPDSAGVYVYAVHSEWVKGQADWLFQLRVKSP